MRFDGMQFRVAPTVVAWHGTDGAEFGRVVKPNTPGAVQRQCIGKGLRWTKPVKAQGRSRTNMVYGADGRIYLISNARCYTSRS